MGNNCDMCDGTYWIMIRDDYGREFARKCPACRDTTRKEKLLGMTGRKIVKTWKDVDFTMNNTRTAMKKLIKFPDSNDFLKFYLSGPQGTGKTMLAEILFYELGMKGNNCVFVQANDLKSCCTKLGATNMPGITPKEIQEWRDFQEKFLTADFSFIDGIGSEQKTPAFDIYLSGIIDGRDNAGLKTIFTTIADPFEKENEKMKMKYSDYTLSRMRYRADCAYLCCEDMRNRKLKK